MIVKRGKAYGVSVYDSALKRKRWVGTFRTLGEAREAERSAARRRGVGRLTCGEFSELWLTNYARAAGATRRTYRYGVAAFVKEFGHVRLSEFDRLTARRWALHAPQSNVRFVRAMFTDAINDQLHTGPNPFSNLRLEQSRGRRKDLIALTEDELTELGEKAREVNGEFGPSFRAMVVFAGYVGLRPGELFALERGDVGRDEVTIRQNLDGTGAIKAPKNGRERIVVLPPPAREALADIPVRLDVPWQFVTPRGRRFTKSSLYYYWNPVRAAFGRPDMDFYELRHFCATHLLELGVSHADVAIQLGHTDGGALVMSTYGHPSEDAARDRVKRAYEANVTRLRVAEDGSRESRSAI